MYFIIIHSINFDGFYVEIMFDKETKQSYAVSLYFIVSLNF